ncbi:hypothetical protein AVEN_19125-1 [Araneus ventricosus]|uniref:Uncharacterized protein n=1 Tax=Araneus ventricosus TaxID=182803 RepID=A0A4Y2UVV8_ARAVE|nr:hypothetical protein AVEN_19125-1 [Araneus ventricosus]
MKRFCRDSHVPVVITLSSKSYEVFAGSSCLHLDRDLRVDRIRGRYREVYWLQIVTAAFLEAWHPYLEIFNSSPTLQSDAMSRQSSRACSALFKITYNCCTGPHLSSRTKTIALSRILIGYREVYWPDPSQPLLEAWHLFGINSPDSSDAMSETVSHYCNSSLQNHAIVTGPHPCLFAIRRLSRLTGFVVGNT